jgi:hypothetical protein
VDFLDGVLYTIEKLKKTILYAHVYHVTNTDFKSEGIHNRICSLCKGTEEWEMGNDYSIMQQ